MLAWKINAVRIPLNEDCWLSLNRVQTDTPVIISNLNGTAACSGITYKAHLLATPH